MRAIVTFLAALIILAIAIITLNLTAAAVAVLTIAVGGQHSTITDTLIFLRKRFPV